MANLRNIFLTFSACVKDLEKKIFCAMVGVPKGRFTEKN